MVTWTYPVLGDSLARCRIRSGVRRQRRRMVRLKLRSPCYAQVLPVEMKFEIKDGLKTSYRYRFLFVPIWPNGLAIKDSTANPLDFVIIKSMFEPLLSEYELIYCLKWVLYVIATDPEIITTIQGFGFPFRKPKSFHLHPLEFGEQKSVDRKWYY